MIYRRIILLILFGLLLTAPQASQAQNSQPQTLSLSPFLFEERLEKGQTIQRQIELINRSSETLQLSAQVSDFTPGQTDSQPVFVPERDQDESRYALSSWMNVTKPPAAILLPGQTTLATVQIKVPIDAEDGSHYGGVLFSYSGKENAPGAVEIVKKAATLFFIRIGVANEQGSITSFTSEKKIYSGGPVNFLTKFSDTGNVHLKPKGNVYIYNLWGRMTAAVQINRDAQIVLPQTERTFVSQWKDKWAFGPYRAEAEIFYGDNKYEARSSTRFWILPVKGILLFLLLTAAAIVLLWKGIKLYNKRVLKKAGVIASVPSNSRKKK